MAEKKKNRKSSRHFNLEKPVERSFVIEKDADILAAVPTKPEENKTQPAAPIAPTKKQENGQLQHAAPINFSEKSGNVKKPSDQPEVGDMKEKGETKTPTIPIPDGGGSTVPSGNGSKWKWLIPAAIVVAAVPSYFYFTGNDKDMSSSEDQIVMNTSNSGQDDANDDAALPNVAAGENSNSENLDNSVGGNDEEDSSSPEKADNPSNSEIGSSSSEPENVGNTSSGAKGRVQPSEGQLSSNNNKPISGTSASSTTSTNSGKEKAGNTSNVKSGSTDLSSSQGKSVPNGSKGTGTKDSAVIPGSVEQKALDVIRGVFGNGQERKDKLGAEYAEIQKLVNEMYRNGLVH